MKSRGVFLLGMCCVCLLAGCEAQITAHVMATLTAAAPTVTPTPTIPPLPTATSLPSGEPQDYAGSFTYGFEVVSFKPCHRDEAWWLDGDAAALTELRTRYAAITQTEQPVHVRLRGLISERGVYGHMGGYQRQLYVQDILEVRAIQPGDCR